MSAVAVERDTVPVATEQIEPGTHAAPGVPEEADRSRLERLALRFMRWSMKHPQTGYPLSLIHISEPTRPTT